MKESYVMIHVIKHDSSQQYKLSQKNWPFEVLHICVGKKIKSQTWQQEKEISAETFILYVCALKVAIALHNHDMIWLLFSLAKMLKNCTNKIVICLHGMYIVHPTQHGLRTPREEKMGE